MGHSLSSGKNEWIRKLIIHVVLIVFGFLMVVPFLWMLSSSFKFEPEIFKIPITWIPEKPTLTNYAAIFFSPKYNFARFYLNSFITASFVTLINVALCSMAGFSFAKFEFPAKNLLFILFLATIMVPFHSIMIPVYTLVRGLGWSDRLVALIVPFSFDALGVFMLRQFIMTLPSSLMEAARIDGASNFIIFLRIVFPMIKAALASLALFQFLWSWNNFLRPLLFIRSVEKMPITMGLQTFVSEYNVEYGKIMAGSSLAIVPVLIIFILGQRYFISGIALDGVKG